MSHDTELERGPDSAAMLEYAERWYHVPAVAAVLIYMLWTRLDALDRFVRDGEVFFRGNDAYYHYRTTMYSVENWPRQLYADPWTNFPYGTTVGNFGSFMDQVVATVALIVGLGDPTARQVAILAVIAPVLIGTLCALLVYGLGAHLSDSPLGGLAAAAVLALVPHPSWVTRSSVGFYDHHVAEAFMMVASVLAMAHAVSVVRQERPVYEQVVDRDWEGLRSTVRASALAGLVLGLYLHVWAPGQVLIGIFGIFFVIAMIHAVLRGESPEYLAFAGVLAAATATLTILPWTLTLELSNNELSFLQVVLLLAVGGGCAFLAWLARYWDREALDPQGYPAAVVGVGAVGFAILWFLLPQAIDSILSGLDRIILVGTSETTLTVSEAQPMDTDNLGDEFYSGYGFTFFTALLAAVWMTGSALFARRPRAEYLLVGVWTVFLTSMAITQVRFHYYLVLAVAVLNGWLVARVVQLAEFPSLSAPDRLETHHVLTVIVILLVLFVPITAGAFVSSAGTTTAAQYASDQQPGSIQYWDDNLDWMAENTPEPGTYGANDNSMEYYGPFEATGDYEYPEGAYGVMSWWDYGHWITVEGERIPNANPFQQGPRAASAYLQEQNESRANQYLEALPADSVTGGDLDGMSDEALQDTIESRTDQEASEETRYVVIDDQMAGGKFSAIAEWAGPGQGAFQGSSEFPAGNDTVTLQALNERYDSTMLSRMYFNDGSLTGEADAEALSHYRLVKESSTQSSVMSIAQQTQDGGLQSTGLVGIDVGSLAQNYPGVYQSIRSGSGPFLPYDVRQESAVKTYERVDGATITGEADPNATIQASVQMETETGRTFPYAQTTTVEDDGSFELTVPYATTDERGPDDGYTDSAVEANGTYTVQAGSAIQIGNRRQFLPSEQAQGVDVPEPAIYEGEVIVVDLLPDEHPGGTETDNNDTDHNANDSSAAGSSGSTAAGSSASSAAGSSASSTAGSSASDAAGSGTDPIARAAAAVVAGAVPVGLARAGSNDVRVEE